MAGTDRTQASLSGGPAIVLVRAQLGENIGVAARAMLNFGLTDLRLVRPKAGWPNVKALNAASGADEVLARVRIFDRVEEAVADLRYVFAATARDRDMVKPVVSAHGAAQFMRATDGAGSDCGVLFGPERTGLTNEEVALAERVITIPLNPAFASLNLAQAVILVAYEWFTIADDAPHEHLRQKGTRAATKDELFNFFGHLEAALDGAGFFPTEIMRPHMVLNLRNLFARAELTEQEVQTLHGVIERLSHPRPPKADSDIG
jgi:tRNA/rRNA methyltransferase